MLAAATLLEHGTDMHKEKFLRRILTGEDTWCQLFSEPGNGSDLAGCPCGPGEPTRGCDTPIPGMQGGGLTGGRGRGASKDAPNRVANGGLSGESDHPVLQRQ